MKLTDKHGSPPTRVRLIGRRYFVALFLSISISMSHLLFPEDFNDCVYALIEWIGDEALVLVNMGGALIVLGTQLVLSVGLIWLLMWPFSRYFERKREKALAKQRREALEAKMKEEDLAAQYKEGFEAGVLSEETRIRRANIHGFTPRMTLPPVAEGMRRQFWIEVQMKGPVAKPTSNHEIHFSDFEASCLPGTGIIGAPYYSAVKTRGGNDKLVCMETVFTLRSKPTEWTTKK